MDVQNIQKLIAINNTFYSENSATFSRTREKPWNGWVKGLELLKTPLSELFKGAKNAEGAKGARGVSVIDFAAGNLRFEKYLLNELNEPNEQGETISNILAIDNCEALLPHDLENYKNVIDFQKTDIISKLLHNAPIVSQISAHLAVSFGFFHHIPSFKLRKCFLKQMVNATKPNGYIFLSLWGFANNEKTRQKAIQSTSAAKALYHEVALETGLEIELEEEDYFLGWQNTKNSYRYCHNFAEPEIHELLRIVSDDTKLIAKFYDDGKSSDANCYLLLRKNSAKIT